MLCRVATSMIPTSIAPISRSASESPPKRSIAAASSAVSASRSTGVVRCSSLSIISTSPRNSASPRQKASSSRITLARISLSSSPTIPRSRR